MFSSLRLPTILTLRFAGCDGDANAWYEPQDATITFCYEYLVEMRQVSASAPRRFVTAEEASNGLMTFVLLHEIGHALFDLLDVPILGKEEDAADAFAVVMLLRFDHEAAPRTVWTVAWAYSRETEPEKLGPDDLADAHALYGQRYYNVLCMAYGGDPKRFAAFTKAAQLPSERADGCGEEYRKARSAIERLIEPSLLTAKRVTAAHGK